MMAANQQFLNLSELTFLRVYPSLKPYILFYSNYWTGIYITYRIFVSRADVGILRIDLMHYQCEILLAISILCVFL